MFTEIEINNFKCLRKFDSKLGSLTLLTGLNASGKSSVIQTLALIRQTVVDSEWSNGFHLNGSSVHLGTMFDVIDRNFGGSGFKIGLGTKQWRIDWETTCSDRKIDLIARFSSLRISSGSNVFDWGVDQLESQPIRRLVPDLHGHEFSDIFGRIRQDLSSIIYIGAERIGPREVYVVQNPSPYADVGAQGEKTPWCLEQFGEFEVNPGLLLEGIPNQVRLTVQAWMNKLFPGFQLSIRRVDSANLITLGIRTSPRGDFFKPANVGFGLTHVLPIVTACVCAKPGALIIVENPEIHLHPEGQSIIGHFLALAASRGIQIILETHSEHVLNGVRRAVKDTQLKAESCRIFFFKSLPIESSGSQTEISEVNIDLNGQLHGWPQGFFDQIETDLDYIFR